MIGKDGTVKQFRSLYERNGCTLNGVNNSEAIQIVVAGNFELEKPSAEQLSSVRALIEQLGNSFHFEEIQGHKDSSPTSCPGKHLEEALSDLWRGEKREVWNITRYYTPVEVQKVYFHGSYEKDFQINCSGDCLVIADSYQLKPDDAFKVAACPPEIAFGTKMDIEGIGVVTCHDRGGAIKEKRIDVWAAIGMEALMALRTPPAGSLSTKINR